MRFRPLYLRAADEQDAARLVDEYRRLDCDARTDGRHVHVAARKIP
jgi:hypothetical protein